jgi:hypothetical protein
VSNELDVLKDVARRLEGAAIPYMLTGSLAANFYTVPRMTRDIDLVVALLLNDVARLVEAFGQDYYCDESMVRDAVRRRGMVNLIHQTQLVKIDLVVRKESEYRRLEFERRRRLTLDGQSFWVVSPEDLVISKLEWARDGESSVQLRDVKNLLSTPLLDMPYVEKWVRALGLESVFQRVRL